MIDEVRRALPGLEVSADAADRVAYARDLWPRHHLAVRAGRVAEHEPAAIVWPTSTADVQRIVRFAGESGTPIVPFGAGSGVCGGVLPHPRALVVDMKRMSAFRRLDASAPLVEVESGHLGVPFEERLGKDGLTLGHFPSSILCSTVGGWVAARSAGQASGLYGKIEDMVVELECVTGRGDVVRLPSRARGPSLSPLVVGSEGTLAVVTSATLRLHPAPRSRSFAAFSFRSTEEGWEAMRLVVQNGLRPAVLRLYDPFDAWLARQGGAKKKRPVRAPRTRGPGLGQAALASVLRAPGVLNGLIDAAAPLFGGAMLLVIFEGTTDETASDLDDARRLLANAGGGDLGEGPARSWLAHRYAVSYRQAPVFMAGGWVDTMEVAATWSKLGAVYDAVREALGKHVFVMAHFSHAYPDGCCVYFTFAGSAAFGAAHRQTWDDACRVTYERAWPAALEAATRAGGTISHHHGVGRSKAPRLKDELGGGVDVVRALMRAFDPHGVLNPGNLLPADGAAKRACTDETPSRAKLEVDETSQLVSVDGSLTLAEIERALAARGVTLGISRGGADDPSVADWLARGAPGARDRFADPADHLVAGLEARLGSGRRVVVRPCPRRAVGPDLVALFVGAGERFGRIERAHLRIHRVGEARARARAFDAPAEAEVSGEEEALLAAIQRELGAMPG